MSTKGLFLLQMAAAMVSVDDVHNPYHQEEIISLYRCINTACI